MINWDRLSRRVYGIVRGSGHDVELRDAEGNPVTQPAEARFFIVSEPSYMVNVDPDNQVVQINRHRETRLEDLDKVTKHLRTLRREFGVKVGYRMYGKAVEPKDQEESLEESKMYGRAKTSYQQFENDVRLVVKHQHEVNPEVPGSRSRSIGELYVESAGERHRLPFRDLGAGRALARHCEQGGALDDSVGEYIRTIAEQLETLKRFSMYNSRQQFAEDATAQEARELAREHLSQLRGEIREFYDPNSYQAAREAVEGGEREALMDEADPDLTGHYSETRVDPRVERALPIVSALRERRYRQLDEMSRQPFVITQEDVITEEDILEYDEPIQNLGAKLGRVVSRAVEETVLSRHLGRVAESMRAGQAPGERDLGLVRQVLANTKFDH